MFSNLSTLGWILIIGLAVFILAINIGLFLGVRQRMEKNNWIDKLTAAGEIMKDPLKKENERFQELSDQVAKLKIANDSNEKKEE